MIQLSDFQSGSYPLINDHENPIREMFIDQLVMCK